MLKASSQLEIPSDIFNNILLGKSVFIDHGFELVPGLELLVFMLTYHILKIQ